AHREHALEAFRHQVSDYLVKPVNIDDFVEAVRKVQMLFNDQSHRKIADENISGTMLRDDELSQGRVLFSRNSVFEAVDLRKVIYVKANGKYSEFYLSNGMMYT